jgi:hypothetical protein
MSSSAIDLPARGERSGMGVGGPIATLEVSRSGSGVGAGARFAGSGAMGGRLSTGNVGGGEDDGT